LPVLNKLASALNRSDEAPNQLLATEIAEAGDTDAVKELVDNLSNKDKDIQSDCIKVLYEVGALKPELIADYSDEFIDLLRSRNNRLVWGAMTALGAIASLRPGDIGRRLDEVIRATEYGSVITQDWGIRVLATVAASDKTYEKRVLPFLTDFLKKCPPKDLPRHAESVLPAVNAGNRATILSVLENRQSSLKAAQAKRLEKVIRQVNAR
jgi:hypothetical protein